MIIAGHFHQRVVSYPIGPLDRPGKLLTNWIVQVTVDGRRAAAARTGTDKVAPRSSCR